MCSADTWDIWQLFCEASVICFKLKIFKTKQVIILAYFNFLSNRTIIFYLLLPHYIVVWEGKKICFSLWQRLHNLRKKLYIWCQLIQRDSSSLWIYQIPVWLSSFFLFVSDFVSYWNLYAGTLNSEIDKSLIVHVSSKNVAYGNLRQLENNKVVHISLLSLCILHHQ